MYLPNSGADDDDGNMYFEKRRNSFNVWEYRIKLSGKIDRTNTAEGRKIRHREIYTCQWTDEEKKTSSKEVLIE